MGVDECGGEWARQGHGSALGAKLVEDAAEELAGKPFSAELRKHGCREQSHPVAGLGVQKSRNGAVLDAEFVDRCALVL
jgi:hypothetical protein